MPLIIGYADEDGSLCLPEFVEGPYMERFNRPLVDKSRFDELVDLLRETRELIRPSAVLQLAGEYVALKSKIDAALLDLPSPPPAERVPGCADAAWALVDKNLYGEYGVLVMPPDLIIQKATSYAGFKLEPEHVNP